MSGPLRRLSALLGLPLLTSPAHSQTAADRERVYSAEEVTVVPVVLRQPAVVYPDSLKRAGIGGAVRVSVVLDQKGHPDSTSIQVVSTPGTDLNAPARAVVLGSRFTAGHVDNHDVRTRLTLDVVFDPLDTARVPAPIYGRNDSLSERPALLNDPHIEYPRALWEQGIEGRVVVQMILDTLGRPEPGSVQFVTTPDPGFIWPVRQFVRAAWFRPARRRGRPVRSIVYLPIDFRLGGLPLPRPLRCGVSAQSRLACPP